MSIKKTTKKRMARLTDKSKRAKTPANKTVKKNIARAVERLPQMIIKEVGLREFAPPLPRLIERPRRSRHRLALMWTGVIMLSSVVFALWFLNTRQALAVLRQSPPSPERQLLQTARTDLREIMQRVAAAEKNEFTEAVNAATPDDAKAAVKSALSLFLSSTDAASSTTSTNQVEITTTTI